MESDSRFHANSCFRIEKEKRNINDIISDAFKKKNDSIRSGMGEEDIYKPIWIFYDVMEAFLKERYECKSIISTGGDSVS